MITIPRRDVWGQYPFLGTFYRAPFWDGRTSFLVTIRSCDICLSKIHLGQFLDLLSGLFCNLFELIDIPIKAAPSIPLILNVSMPHNSQRTRTSVGDSTSSCLTLTNCHSPGKLYVSVADARKSYHTCRLSSSIDDKEELTFSTGHTA